MFENQPSPFRGSVRQIWVLCLVLLGALMTLAQVVLAFCTGQEVFRSTYSFSPRTPGEASFVTDVFELKGRPSDVELTTRTDLANNWAYFSFALINSDNGQAFDFGREVSYYYGRDSDGSWTEGDANDRVLIPTVPAGHYYLRIEPEMDPNAAPVRYEVTLRRDVPALSFLWIAALLLVIPPAFVSFRAMSFEKRRWQESDYAPSASAAAAGDDD